MTSAAEKPGTPEERPSHTIAALAPTLATLFGIEAPGVCQAAPLSEVVDRARGVFREEPPGRCLVYVPDALGLHLAGQAGHLFDGIRRHAPMDVHLCSVRPSKTPVCLASMFTGAPPEVHGIRRYERPVLGCDTLFDALVRAGKRVVLVAVEGCSMDLIFRGRAMDYFSEDYDPEVTETTLDLLRLGRHDLIVAYHQEYDDLLHETSPFSPRALRAAERHVDTFRRMVETAHRAWRHHHHLVVLAPDHGAALDPASGKGTHGGDSPQEMEVAHFWGFHRGRKTTRPVERSAAN